MNTAATTQRIQTTCALSIALLISGTTSANQGFEQPGSEVYRQGYESFAVDTPSCDSSQDPRIIIFGGARQTATPCSDANTTITPPVRLARPLSGRQYIRSGDSIRYSF
ncbi:hypothetical protein NAV33_16500 [Pseudomonas stutzeri]|uniref:hypothetical protein n=1 Tax=Stutzerimonas stutzeri TaxID=316 RepID=UPI002109FDF7|nr:hypothetical protein [Stutzerimonas stutzeri]MCQ4313476.1 hypothetical protein [Stutzerimonas stutzeri]